MQVAPNMTVKLIKGDSGQVADIDETNFFGKYTFEGINPGYYKLQAGEVVRELIIKGKDDEKRIDIDLSAKGGAMDYSGTAGTADQQTKATTGVKTKANNQDLANQIAGASRFSFLTPPLPRCAGVTNAQCLLFGASSLSI